MATDRYVVLGLGNARSQWFTDLARWATSAVVPVDFMKCMSADEARARLASGRSFSALIGDGAAHGFDRDLIAEARAANCAVFAIEDPRVERDWVSLGCAAALPRHLDRSTLLAALADHSTPVIRADASSISPEAGTPKGWRGHLIVVTGRSGAGTSSVAMALAQGLASDPRNSGLVALADLALNADQSMYHDATERIPGLQELVEAHRVGRPTIDETRSLLFTVEGRGYDLLLGLRRHRDWTALRPRSLEAAIDGLRRCYRYLVCDVEPDLEGQDETGSIDVEERNAVSRLAVDAAAAVLAVGAPGMKGLRDLVGVILDVSDRTAGHQSILPVINRAPRSPRARAELSATLHDLIDRSPSPPVGVLNPLFLADRRGLEHAHRDVAVLPAALVSPLAPAVLSVIDEAAPAALEPSGPRVVVPGSVGALSDEIAAS
ncbi:MAG: hypothetical protein JJLCMIEE_00603 [Acidimicrobiales bacterium]|nr:MAG: hypothetical protein EDR02_16650 [Actinomycetota bacterium]MBV6507554.1 hypothetical protein [Acidimicrobiales bacterium]RIK07493.1 MAG: hypothetical protein DCC48_03040 [Acidobacteriota bacterium]